MLLLNPRSKIVCGLRFSFVIIYTPVPGQKFMKVLSGYVSQDILYGWAELFDSKKMFQSHESYNRLQDLK